MKKQTYINNALVFIITLLGSIKQFYLLPIIIFISIKKILRSGSKPSKYYFILIIFSFFCLLSIFLNDRKYIHSLYEVYISLAIGFFLIEKRKVDRLLKYSFYILLGQLLVGLLTTSYYLICYGRTQMIADGDWHTWYFTAGGINGLFYSLSFIGPLYLSSKPIKKKSTILLFFLVSQVAGTLITGNHQKAVLLIELFTLFIFASKFFGIFSWHYFLVTAGFVSALIVFLILDFKYFLTNVPQVFINKIYEIGGVRFQEYLNLTSSDKDNYISTESTLIRVFDIYGPEATIGFLIFLGLIYFLVLKRFINDFSFNVNHALVFIGLSNFILLSFFCSNLFIFSYPPILLGWYYLLRHIKNTSRSVSNSLIKPIFYGNSRV
jgi:hypothetical protein